jgi:hypothetical protein
MTIAVSVTAAVNPEGGSGGETIGSCTRALGCPARLRLVIPRNT